MAWLSEHEIWKWPNDRVQGLFSAIKTNEDIVEHLRTRIRDMKRSICDIRGGHPEKDRSEYLSEKSDGSDRIQNYCNFCNRIVG